MIAKVLLTVTPRYWGPHSIFKASEIAIATSCIATTNTIKCIIASWEIVWKVGIWDNLIYSRLCGYRYFTCNSWNFKLENNHRIDYVIDIKYTIMKHISSIQH